MSRQRSETPVGYSQTDTKDVYQWKQALHIPDPVTDTNALPVVLLEQVRIDPVDRNPDPLSILLLAGTRRKVHLLGRLVVEKDSDGESLLRKYKSKRIGDSLNGATILVDEIHDYSIGYDPLTLWFRTIDSPWFEVEPHDNYRDVFEHQADAIRLFYTVVDFYEGFATKGERYLVKMCRETGFHMPVQPWFNHDICLRTQGRKGDFTDVDFILKLFLDQTNGIGMTMNDIYYLVAEYANWLIAHFNLTARQNPKQSKGPSVDWNTTSFLAWIKQAAGTWTSFLHFEQEILALHMSRDAAWTSYYTRLQRNPPPAPIRPSRATQDFSHFIVFGEPPPESEDEVETYPNEMDDPMDIDSDIPYPNNHPLPSVEISSQKPNPSQKPQKSWCSPYHGLYTSPQYPSGLLPGHGNLDNILATIYHCRLPCATFSNTPRCPDSDLTFNHLLDMYYRDFSTTWRDTFKALLCRFGPRIREAMKKEGLMHVKLYEELNTANLKQIYKDIKDRYKSDADEFSLDGITDRKVMAHRNPSKAVGPRVRDKGDRSGSSTLANRPKNKPLSGVKAASALNSAMTSRRNSKSKSRSENGDDAFTPLSNLSRDGTPLGPSRLELRNRDPKKVSRSRERSPVDEGVFGGEEVREGVKRIRRMYSGF